MKKMVVIAACLFLFFGSNAFATPFITVYDAADTTSINAWKAALGGIDVELETFEEQDVGWYDELLLSSGLGTFTAGGGIGLGNSSYNALHDTDSNDPYFRISNEDVYGRIGGNNFLDSADITMLTFDLAMNLTNLWFYIQDPSDQGAITTVKGKTESFSDEFTFGTNEEEPNAAKFFVGISVEDDFLTQITWETSGSNLQKDGYGLDDFHTVVVPEPTTMMLLGFGLLGLAGVTRRNMAGSDQTNRLI